MWAKFNIAAIPEERRGGNHGSEGYVQGSTVANPLCLTNVGSNTKLSACKMASSANLNVLTGLASNGQTMHTASG